jgi:molybdopterin synthase sulfur carrier subunit
VTPNSHSEGAKTVERVNLQLRALVASGGSRYNPVMPPVAQTVRVKVLFFGRLKDVVGHAEESFDLADASTIEELFALYAARIPELAKYRSSVVASRNQEFASWDTPLRPGDEVAFLPPVSGG